MNPDMIFKGPFLKVERAEQHITELEAIFQQIVDQYLESLRPQNYQPEVFTIGRAMPRMTSTILGDAIHNLRAALDHAYCLLVEANGGTIDRYTTFPIHRGTESDFRGAVNGCKGQKNSPSDAVLDLLINEIQAFPGGKGESLVGLHDLDISDKHTVLLPTITSFGIEELIVEFPGGVSIISGLTVHLNDSSQSAVGLAPGTRIKHSKAKADVTFGPGQPFQGESVLQRLHDLTVVVKSTLEILRAA